MKFPRHLVRALARVQPNLPRRVTEAAIALHSLLATDTPVVALPRVRRAMVLAPHPDDETIGCGGTIARLTATGAQVTVVLVTDGEATIGSPHRPATTARLRRAEAAAACASLGAEPPIALGLPDGHVVEHTASLARALASLHGTFDPQLLFTPWVLERHPDHRAVTAALARITGAPDAVWGYEAHTPIPLPDRLVDISEVVDRKQAALAQHTTAALAFDLQTTMALARWRSLAAGGGHGAAEAFLTLPAVRLAALAAQAERAWTGERNPRPGPPQARAGESLYGARHLVVIQLELSQLTMR